MLNCAVGNGRAVSLKVQVGLFSSCGRKKVTEWQNAPPPPGPLPPGEGEGRVRGTWHRCATDGHFRERGKDGSGEHGRRCASDGSPRERGKDGAGERATAVPRTVTSGREGRTGAGNMPPLCLGRFPLPEGEG
ncbi:hypothetical protein CHU32_23425 [Superficieibacter electus]|uniref:Uncharacterized protein n=1 Tax=Superficieibacter electus TaxID=2022662 RepID=A0A2P5GIZ6_9ENTR|nr:hypothetical protein CHU32_23425 [Superficieibacter electus]